MNMQAREDWCLVRIVEIGHNPTGILIPQFSIEGKRFEIVSVGPKVIGLQPGDNVLMIGQKNATYYQVPNTKDLIVIKQDYVCLVFEDEADLLDDASEREREREREDKSVNTEPSKTAPANYLSNDD